MTYSNDLDPFGYVTADIQISVHGHYRRATRLDPPEFPDITLEAHNITVNGEPAGALAGEIEEALQNNQGLYEQAMEEAQQAQAEARYEEAERRWEERMYARGYGRAINW